MDNSEVEWETCKENVQRIRGGRSMTKIMQSLKCTDSEDILKEQRREFENDLRTYEGDDPLEIWSRYVKWTEENFWTDCKVSLKFELVEKCIRRFNEGDRYSNDHRYLDIWIHFMAFCKDPLIVCKYLYKRLFFLKLAKFYQTWAEFTELQNTTESGGYYLHRYRAKHVDSIFLKGIANKAEPLERLKCLHSQFLMRSLKKTMTTQASSTVDNHESVDMDICDGTTNERKAFNFLNTKSSHAPINRVGHQTAKSSIIKTRKGNQNALQMACAPDNNPRTFQVYAEDQQRSSHSTVVSDLDSAPSDRRPRILTSEIDKENKREAGSWNRSKDMKSTKTANPAAKCFVTPAKSTFSIFCDSKDVEIKTKPSESKLTKLSIRKKVKPSLYDDIFEEILHSKDIKSDPHFSFDFDILYGGVDEFSFEEISAARWFFHHKDVNFLPNLPDDSELSNVVDKLHLEDTPSISKHVRRNDDIKSRRPLNFDIISE